MRSKEDELLANAKRCVSQVTGFVCAKCGGITKMSNASKLHLTVDNLGNGLCKIYFQCSSCCVEYNIGLADLN